MPLKYLENQEMLAISDVWITPGTDANAAFSKRPLTKAVLVEVGLAHRELLRVTGTVDSKLAPIMKRQRIADDRHDDVVPAIILRLESEERATTDPAKKAMFQRAREAFFPEGVGLVQRSYDYEGGHGLVVAEELGPEERALLGSLKTYSGTLLDLMEEYLKLTEELRRLGELRAQVADEGQPSRQERVAARNGWIRMVRMMEDAAERTAAGDPDVEKAIRALHRAEQEATRRYMARARTGAAGADDDDLDDDGNVDDDGNLDDDAGTGDANGDGEAGGSGGGEPDTESSES